MKPFWITTGILTAMICLLLLSGARLERLTQPLLDQLPQATAAAERGDWETARALTQQIRGEWNAELRYLRLVQSHLGLNEISLLLEESVQFLTCRDLSAYAAANARLTGLLEGMQEAERFSVENLL